MLERGCEANCFLKIVETLKQQLTAQATLLAAQATQLTASQQQNASKDAQLSSKDVQLTATQQQLAAQAAEIRSLKSMLFQLTKGRSFHSFLFFFFSFILCSLTFSLSFFGFVRCLSS